MIGYHNTDHIISDLNYDELYNNISNHDNGAMGLWCSVKDDWQKGFGKNTYKVEVTGEAYNMPVNELQGLCYNDLKSGDRRPYYKKLRDDMLKRGFTHIRILERHRGVDMFIVCDFNYATIERVSDGNKHLNNKGKQL
jgi:hypothetical protein